MGVLDAAGTVSYETRVCPRCGSELYADMVICYGCLYDFERDETSRSAIGLPVDIGEVERGEGLCDTEDLSAVSLVSREREKPGVLVRTASVDLWLPVSEQGLAVGRDPSNDVVLHSPAVSRRHLRMASTPDGMEVSDMGSTNPAMYRGREVSGCVIVPYGDAIDVCGCLLTMTGPSSG